MKACIHLIFAGKRLGTRVSDHIPRVGDMLSLPTENSKVLALAKVTKVIWVYAAPPALGETVELYLDGEA